MGFLSRIFGIKSPIDDDQDVPLFPEENFAVIEGKLIDGRPFVGSLNLAYREYRLKSRYPWFLKLGIGLEENNCTENGLPRPDESNIANRMEDRLVEKIRSLTTAHYLGHIFSDSFLDVYLHLDDPEPAHQYLQQLIIDEDHERGFGYEITNDPSWSVLNQWID